MADTGPTLCGSGTTEQFGGENDWSNPGRLTAEDGSLAECFIANNASTYLLKATDFGFAVPGGATIDGILARWKRRMDTGGVLKDVVDAFVGLLKGGSVEFGSNKSAGASWSGSLTWDSFGGAADLWSVAWTPADINSSGFGACLQAENAFGKGDENTAYVDTCEVTVWFTTTAAGCPKQMTHYAKLRRAG